MMVKEIRIKAVAQGQKGEFSIDVNADIDRKICLLLVLESVKTMSDVSVILPVQVVDMEGKVRPVNTEDTVKTLLANNIKIEGVNEMEEKNKEEKSFEEMMKDAFAAVEEQLDKASETIVKKGGKAHITRILNAPDKEVYGEILASLDILKSTIAGKVVDSTKGLFKAKKPNPELVLELEEVMTVKDSLSEAVEELMDNATDKVTVMDRIKALAVLVFKKTVALLKGVVSFTFDATTILGAAVGRVTYHTAKELLFAGKAIGQAFNKDVIQAVKNA